MSQTKLDKAIKEAQKKYQALVIRIKAIEAKIQSLLLKRYADKETKVTTNLRHGLERGE